MAENGPSFLTAIYIFAPKEPSVGTLLTLTYMPRRPMREQIVLPTGLDGLISISELNSVITRMETIFQKHYVPQWLRSIILFMVMGGTLTLAACILATRYGHDSRASAGIYVGLAVSFFALFLASACTYHLRSTLEREVAPLLETMNQETVSRGYHW
jgi:hypothetical protein